MILSIYERMVKIPAKHPQDLIDEFSKVARYKINIQNQLHFYKPITNFQKEIKIIPFTIASK